MKTKRKGPRYTWLDGCLGPVDWVRGERLYHRDVVRLLNAGEREVKRLRTKLKALKHHLAEGHTLLGQGGDGVWWCRQCGVGGS